jgi:hypothetical protein
LVGIGTTDPDQALTVNGAVHAKEVLVDTGWSDYVFAPGYKLAPLSQVEKAIKADGHLPGIPSAGDVAKHGISVGDIDAKLLAKIEELTLHQIEQEKVMSAQEKLMAEQQGEMARQEQRIDALEKENARLQLAKP